MTKRARKPSPPGKQTANLLPDAELEVLASLWNYGPQTAADIRKSLAGFRPMAHGSVLTLLKRLSVKGLVTREKAGQGKAFVYRAARSPKPTYRRILKKLKHRVFGGSSVALVASLLESQPTSQEELQELKQLLLQLEQNKSGGRS